MTTLTPRDRSVLTWLWKHPRATIGEMMAGCDIPSTSSVWYRLERLNHLGYVKPGPRGTRRTRTLTGKGLLAAQGFECIFWEPVREEVV